MKALKTMNFSGTVRCGPRQGRFLMLWMKSPSCYDLRCEFRRFAANREHSVKIAVCTTTFQRPQSLKEMFDGIRGQCFSGDLAKPREPSLQLIIVDNDPEGSARDTVEQFRKTVPWPVRYHIEEGRGISHGRNRAIAETEADVDFVVFIDDDMIPEAGWLQELIQAQQRYDADVVAGLVLPRFEKGTSEWVARGGLFDHPRYATGHPLTTAATNSVLIRRSIFHTRPEPFDVRYGLTGGGDRHFFRGLYLEGKRMVWCDEAVAYDSVPLSRTRFRYLMSRIYGNGCNNSRIELDYGRIPWVHITVFGKALFFIVLGICLTPLGCLQGRSLLVRYLRYAAYGFGAMAALTGRHHQEYHKTPGR